MKQFKGLLIAIIFALALVPSIAVAATNPSVTVDGQQVNFNVPPKIENGVTMVQFRPIFESLGLSVDYDKKTGIITGKKDGLVIKLTIGSKVAIVNGEKVKLDTAPKMVNGSTVVPLRFVSESSGNNIVYDNKTNSIAIQSTSEPSVTPEPTPVESKYLPNELPTPTPTPAVTATPTPTLSPANATFTMTSGNFLYPIDDVVIQLSTPGTIYIMPAGVSVSGKDGYEAAIKSGTGRKVVITEANKVVTIPSTEFAPGRYYMWSFESKSGNGFTVYSQKEIHDIIWREVDQEIMGSKPTMESPEEEQAWTAAAKIQIQEEIQRRVAAKQRQ